MKIFINILIIFLLGYAVSQLERYAYLLMLTDTCIEKILEIKKTRRALERIIYKGSLVNLFLNLF